MGFGAGLILFLLLLTAGFLFYESADLRNGGLGLLLSCGCGGALAGVQGGKPKKKRSRRLKYRPVYGIILPYILAGLCSAL